MPKRSCKSLAKIISVPREAGPFLSRCSRIPRATLLSNLGAALVFSQL
jgi:hypothetical protein